MANGIEAGRAFMRLFIDDKSFRRGLDGAARRLKSFGAGVANIGATFAKLGGVLTAPLAASVKFASDAEETFSKFDTVFGANAEAVRAWGDELAAQVGRSKTEVAGFVAGFQDLLVPIGIDPERAEQSSKQLTQLAIDLASFNNKTDADAVRDLEAALTGSSEVMKKYGVIVNEAAVKQELLNEGIDPKSATEQEKVFARLNIIMRGTTAAQGDAIRTADGFANSAKALGASVRDAGAAMGSALLAPLASLARIASRAAVAFGQFAERNAELVRGFALVAVGIAAMGGVLITAGVGLGLAGAAIAGLSSLLGVLATAAAAVISPVGLAVGAVVGLGVAIVRYTEAGATAVQFLKDQLGSLAAPLTTAFAAVKAALASGDVAAAAEVLMASLRATVAVGVAKIKAVWATIQGFFVGIWYDAVAGVIVAMGGIQSTWARAVGAMKEAWATFTAAVQTGWATAQNYVTQGVLKAQKFITETLTGEEFDISVELNTADQQLRATINDIRSTTDQAITNARAQTDAAVERIQNDRQAALEAIDNQEAERRAKLNQEVAAAQQEAERLKAALANTAKETEQAAKEAGDGRDNRFGDALKRASDSLTGAAQRVASAGTFSGRAAAAAIGSGNAEKEAQQERKKQTAALNKIARQTKGAGIPVVA